MKKSFDVIVVGLGAMGSAALYQLAQKGAQVLGIDQYTPPHNLGSTHGDSRITRQAVGEGEQYVPLALRSYEIWAELEKLTATQLLVVCGGLTLESQNSRANLHGSHKFLEKAAQLAAKYQIKHSLLDTPQIKTRFPQFNVTDEMGYFEDMSGYLRPEACVQAQLNVATQLNAQIHYNEPVLEIIPAATNDRVTIKTALAEYEAGKVVISVGAWLKHFLAAQYQNYFKVYRQVMYWFEAKDNINMFLPKNFPIFIWIAGNENDFGFYGFPSTDQQTIKVASEQFYQTTTPTEIEREVSSAEIEVMCQTYLATKLPGLSANCLKAATCLYTNTPNSHFVIDTLPQHPQVLLASPCSGHGFKHSAAIGEVLAQLALTGQSSIDISSFTLRRLTQE